MSERRLAAARRFLYGIAVFFATVAGALTQKPHHHWLSVVLPLGIAVIAICLADDLHPAEAQPHD